MINDIGGNLGTQSQGGSSCQESEGTFGSRFGLGLPTTNVFLRIEGRIVGSELVFTITNPEAKELLRTTTSKPDWQSYRRELEAEFLSRLSSTLR